MLIHSFKIRISQELSDLLRCHRSSELPRIDEQQPVQVLTRGMAVKGIDSALSPPKTGDGAPLRWGQDSIVVSTFPKP
jgi:hypothetical protein